MGNSIYPLVCVAIDLLAQFLLSPRARFCTRQATKTTTTSGLARLRRWLDFGDDDDFYEDDADVDGYDDDGDDDDERILTTTMATTTATLTTTTKTKTKTLAEKIDKSCALELGEG